MDILSDKKENVTNTRVINKFLDFFRLGTFIVNTHMKPKSPSK